MRAQRGWNTAEEGGHPDQQEPTTAAELSARYVAVRQQSVDLCAPLEIEDYGVQPMDDASPPKWHLAHTTWFFETFILKSCVHNYTPFNPHYEYLFNSYYNGVGMPFPRLRRGFLSRPTVAEVIAYRKHVDQQMLNILGSQLDQAVFDQVLLGLHHEQQHQELLLTDIKFNFGHNPLHPVYSDNGRRANQTQPASRAVNGAADSALCELSYVEFSGGIVEVGAADGFAFDNERPRHQVLLAPFKLANRLVTNSEYLAFVQDGGYQRAELWLSDGWTTVQSEGWQAPLYWRAPNNETDAWHEYRLDGLHPLDGDLPVVHISGHEAFAYANWVGGRLPTEFEWEYAAAQQSIEGAFVESCYFHPSLSVDQTQANNGRHDQLHQLFGEAWQWTSSSYAAYPGYRPLPGTLGEYNGKFMSSQLVLRGGSCATPRSHARVTYRNFFYPPDRWQFSGMRLAFDGE